MRARIVRTRSEPSLPTSLRLATCANVRCGIGIAHSSLSCGKERLRGAARRAPAATRVASCPAASTDACSGSGGLAVLVRDGRAPLVLARPVIRLGHGDASVAGSPERGRFRSAHAALELLLDARGVEPSGGE